MKTTEINNNNMFFKFYIIYFLYIFRLQFSSSCNPADNANNKYYYNNCLNPVAAKSRQILVGLSINLT